MNKFPPRLLQHLGRMRVRESGGFLVRGGLDDGEARLDAPARWTVRTSGWVVEGAVANFCWDWRGKD